MSNHKFDIRYENLLRIGYSVIDISGKVLDDMLLSGIYEGYDIINAPSEFFNKIIVTRHNENWIVQEAKDITDRVFLRSFRNKEWSTWQEIVSNYERDKEIIVVNKPHTHQIASQVIDVFMSSLDKAKLDVLDDVLGINIDNGTISNMDLSNISLYEERITNLENNQARIIEEGLLDERYLPCFSKDKPTHQHIAGQVWIYLQD